MRRRTTRTTLGLAVLLAAGATGIPGTASALPSCYDTAARPTVEEQRLEAKLTEGGPAVGPELVKRAGFSDSVSRFSRQLCEQRSASQAAKFVEQEGNKLWRQAVTRAQGAPHAHDVDDDRPLYWARLHLTKTVRQWKPAFPLSSTQRADLVRRADRASRGLNDAALSSEAGVRRVLVSGFDPFHLDDGNVRHSNPSGTVALQLDGRTVTTPTGKVVFQAAVLPVSWSAFDEGIVEQFFGEAMKQRVMPDAFVTISQGSWEDAFDIERWAGRWRGGAADNNDAKATGPAPATKGRPQPATEFIETTLPHQKMVDAGTGPYKVALNPFFCEWKVGKPVGTEPDCRGDEPTPGAKAAQGGGGDYLSNESMYRANRLRVGFGAKKLMGGHLHTPILALPVDPAALTDADFESRRRVIADQVRALLSAM
ncbi:hypothetical protein [Allokutzneria oryzae]|uniref:Pyroglutamyl peptidase n=1 Tax=Allokutzneria oryzae TaxID=1378989 RepID=A0ABV5ZYY2_9PSEU